MKALKIILRIIIYILVAVVISFCISFGVIYYQTSRESIKYQDKIQKYSEEYNMDPLFIASIIKVESGFHNSATSSKSAKGLMQIMDDTASHIAEIEGIDYLPDKLDDVDYNLNLGTSYIRYLYDYYGNYDLALAAYNGGIGNVDSWLNDGILERNNPDTDNIPIKETREYVRKVNSNYSVFKTFYKDKLPEESKLENRFKLSIDNYKAFLSSIIDNA
ncbi:MAG: lytic transglycosylase domain-containing protein [Tissierellia bacterium]|nr:lytic transglycosylase domain-containing protein [Tissierellia bacterium]